jgi:putative transposase
MHYHVVLEADRKALSAGMHHLNGLYAQRLNKCYERVGHVFAGRFTRI